MLARPRSAGTGGLLTALALLAGGAPGAGAQSTLTAERRLSDERALSRWAYVEQRVRARRAPHADAAPVALLRPFVRFTGSPELVLALREGTDTAGRVWVQVRLPVRPNGRTGWIPRDRLGPLRVVRTRLLVERRTFRAILTRTGTDGRRRVLWRSRIGVGVPRWPTPRGSFYVRERLVVPRTPRLRAIYGPFAFGTSAHAPTLSGGEWGDGVIGVHGTGSPALLPGRVSHGCVRVPNAAVRRLWRLLPLGTPVTIR